jgi:hypothetical protein
MQVPESPCHLFDRSSEYQIPFALKVSDNGTPRIFELLEDVGKVSKLAGVLCTDRPECLLRVSETLS